MPSSGLEPPRPFEHRPSTCCVYHSATRAKHNGLRLQFYIKPCPLSIPVFLRSGWSVVLQGCQPSTPQVNLAIIVKDTPTVCTGLQVRTCAHTLQLTGGQNDAAPLARILINFRDGSTLF